MIEQVKTAGDVSRADEYESYIRDGLRQPIQTLVNTVNCKGVMGKGVALAFKQQPRFGDMYRDYKRRCAAGRVEPGVPYLYPDPPNCGNAIVAEQLGLFAGTNDHKQDERSEPWVLNFPTKNHWKERSKISYLERGLDHLKLHYKLWGITSLAIPALGCENGRLEWATVGPMLYRRLDQLDIPVILYAPRNVPAEQASVEFLAGAS
ncbi:macro domain-containing protein [Candidatus Poriferisodalis sp.]|uniref:macro domain-containing protein n=1 Tax=Candidatus Poriferisodalis sp. TaxID=3101277 RepID=UPI003B011678